MTKLEVDWRLEEAPDANEAPTEPAPNRPRWRLSQRALIVLLATTMALAVGVWGFTQLGWQRLRAQLAREVAYEETHSQAGAVELVLAIQAETEADWRSRRAAEVAAGLAAPLPAAHLVPLAAPAQIVETRLAGAALYEVLVRRAYLDPADQVAHFEVWQRYRNRGPGLWERLPPDFDRSASPHNWTGKLLNARFPGADAPLLEPLLPQVDSVLANACEAWGCPAGTGVLLDFVGQVDALPVITPTVRVSTTPGGSYPITFDVALNRPVPPALGDGAAHRLPAPQLTGWPADDVAHQAFMHALTVQALLFLADELAGPSARSTDPFRDALVARQALRLGLAPANLATLAPAHYRSPDRLWATTRRLPATPTEFEVAHRLQALYFLDFVLDGQPPTWDGALLHTLRDHLQLLPWLAALPGSGIGPAAELLQQWEQRVTDGFAQQYPADLSRLEGLAFACLDGTWLVRHGQAVRILPGRLTVLLTAEALSPDGRSLALADQINSTSSELHIANLATLEWATRRLGGGLRLLGWSAAGELVYLRQGAENNNVVTRLELVRYDPVLGRQRLFPNALFGPPIGEPFWSPDHRWLGLPVQQVTERQGIQNVPAVIALEGGGPQPIGEGAFAMAVSPDGSQVAILQALRVGGDPPQDVVSLYDVQRQTMQPLFSVQALDPTRATIGVLNWLQWSPDGRRLTFMALDPANAWRAYAFHLEQGRLEPLVPVPLEPFPGAPHFSADSHYWAAYEPGDHANERRLSVFDLAEGTREYYQATQGVWSPSGHQLALGSRAGVYVVDAASGAQSWVKTGQCTQVAWYAFNP